jgi:hypothetical protein
MIIEMRELLRDNKCPYCGKWFHRLGIMNHRARCYEKWLKAKELTGLDRERVGQLERIHRIEKR